MKKVQNRRTKMKFKRIKKSTLGIFTALFAFVGAIFIAFASEKPKLSIVSVENKHQGDKNVVVNVNLDNDAAKEYNIINLTVNYDPDVLEYKTFRAATVVNPSADEFDQFGFLAADDIVDIDKENGVITLNYVIATDPDTDEYRTANESIDSLGRIVFNVKDDAKGGKSNVTISSAKMALQTSDTDPEEMIDIDTEDGYVEVVIPVDEASVKLAQTDYVIQKGETDDLVVEYTPEDTTDSKEFTYTPADNTIVSVDENGKITALKSGTTTITVNAFGKTLTANVEVRADVKKVEITGDKHELAKNETLQLEATITPSDADDKTLTWASTNPNVASVDANGKVTAKTNGTTTITATSVNNIVGEYEVSVVVPVTSFTTTDDEIELSKGESKTIATTIEPEDATNKTITWKSSDESVATVDDNGKVTGIKGGNATITGTLSNGMKVTAEVSVVVPLESISLDTDSIELVPNGDHTFVATKNPTDTTDTRDVTWESSDATIASVDNTGKVTAKKAGTATITAKVGDIKATATVKVLKMIDSVAMSDPEATLNKNDTKELSVIVNPNDTDEKYTITWKSSDTSVATVDNNGKVTAKKGGETTITATVKSATSEDKEVTCDITVVVPLTSISLNKTTTKLEKGKDETLTVSYEPTDTTDDKTVTWTSNDDTIASVSNGKVTAKKAGTATITAKVGELTAVCTVEVIVPITSVTINNKPTESLNRGDTVNLTATVGPDDTTDDKTVTWTSSKEDVATVDANGAVIAKGAGKTTITAKAGNKTDTVEIEVVVPIESFEINKTETTIVKGKTETLTTTINPSDTTEETKVTWESSDNSVATVDANGKVTGKAQGTATITGKLANGMSVRCTVTVKIIPVESIDITDDKLEINKKDNKTLKVKINPEDATEVTEIEWTSSDEEVATVDENGKVTGVKEGTATITAKMGDLTDTVEVTVKEIPLEEISLSNNNKKLQAGKSMKLSITLNPVNTTDDVTFTYKSSDDSIATVDENGNITAKKTGKVKIKVLASNGLEEEIEIEVTAPVSPKTGVTPTSVFAGLIGILSVIGIFILRKVKI